MKVLVADRISEEGVDDLRALGCDVACAPDATGEVLARAVAESDCNILVVRGTKVTADMIRAGKQLSLIVRVGAGYDSIDIGPAMAAFEAMLRPLFDGRPADTTEENIQSRARGLTLMGLSNKLGYMVLSTGNKSEMSVGYATLYGDMCGGYNVLKDVYKTTVYQLSRWRNQELPKAALGPAGRVIPERIITKAPSAELKPDQTDQDSLPPYAVLDDILECLVEGEQGIDEIAARGHDAQVVRRVSRMLDLAEYKRRQAPPGVKITSRAFGRDRRYPLTNRFTTGS